MLKTALNAALLEGPRPAGESREAHGGVDRVARSEFGAEETSRAPGGPEEAVARGGGGADQTEQPAAPGVRIRLKTGRVRLELALRSGGQQVSDLPSSA